MRSGTLTTLMLLAVAPYIPAKGEAPEILFPKTVYRPGERVVAVVKASGEVGIENDIQQKSFSIKVDGSREVDLGTIPKHGVYTVRVLSRRRDVAAVLLAYHEGPDLRLLVSTKPANEPPAVAKGVVDRFAAAVTKKRLQEAGKKAVAAWLPKNIASLGATTTYCFTCVVPSGQFACPACVSSAGGNVVDLSLEVLTELAAGMERDKILSKEEASAIKKVIQYGNGGFAILTAGGKLERATEGVKFVVETVIENSTATVFIGNGADQVSKANLLIKITKKF